MVTPISSLANFLITTPGNSGGSGGTKVQTSPQPQGTPTTSHPKYSLRDILEKGKARVRAKKAAEAKQGQAKSGNSKTGTSKTPTSSGNGGKTAQPSNGNGTKPGTHGTNGSGAQNPKPPIKKLTDILEEGRERIRKAKEKANKGSPQNTLDKPIPEQIESDPRIPIWDGKKVVHLPGVKAPGVFDGAEVWDGGYRKYPVWKGEKNGDGMPVGPGHWELPEWSAKKYIAADPISHHTQVGDVALLVIVGVWVVGVVTSAGTATALVPATAAADESYFNTNKETPGTIGYDPKNQLYYIVENDGEKLIGFESEKAARAYRDSLYEGSAN